MPLLSRGSPRGSNFQPIPTGKLLQLRPSELRRNPNNPRRLFDEGPMADLRENIREHGVLVPITVYQLAGQDLFAILDGERRFRCCLDLEAEGLDISIPANIVEPPTKVAGLLYMFNIHNYREQWELMPTALSLKIVMGELETEDDHELANLTGLNLKTVQRCKTLLSFPERYQAMSLTPDTVERIPSNFWIESAPVLDLVDEEIPEVASDLGRTGVIDLFVAKYRSGAVKSVIDFRRVVEAFDVARQEQDDLRETLRRFVLDPAVETRSAFDPFVADSRRVRTALDLCRTFVKRISASQLTHVVDDRAELIRALGEVRDLAADLLVQLEGEDAPNVDVPDLGQ